MTPSALPERMAVKITVARASHRVRTPCWLWSGETSHNGYGRMRDRPGDSISRRAHRATYELLVGAIPADHDLDHLCRVRLCCNPDHLEPVTRQENLVRAWAAAHPCAIRRALGRHTCRRRTERTP